MPVSVAATPVPLEQIDFNELTVPEAQSTAIPLDAIDPSALSLPGVPLDQVDPQLLKTGEQWVSGLPRNRLIEEALKSKAAGQDISAFRRAYVERAREGNIIDDDRSGEQLAPKPGLLKRGWDGMGHLFEGGFKVVDNVTRALGTKGLVSGVPSSPDVNERAKLLDEVVTAAQVGTASSLNDIRQGVISVANKVYRKGENSPWDNDAFNEQFDSDLAAAEWIEKASQGEKLKGAQNVDPEAVMQMAPATDASMLLPIGVGYKTARTAAPVAAAVLEKAVPPSMGAAALASTARASASALRKTQRAVDESPLLHGIVAAGATSVVGGDAGQAMLAGLLGANVKSLGIAKKTLGGAANVLEKQSDQLLGKIPPGPMGAFAAAAARAVRPELKGAALGQLANTPFLLGAQSEDEFKDLLATGLVGHAVGSGAGHVLNGLSISRNYFAPGDRAPEMRLPVKDVGIDATLDAAHQSVVSKLNNASNNFVQALRDFSKKDGGEVYTLGKADYEKYIDGLVGQTAIGTDGRPVLVTPQFAETAKRQQGLRLTLPGEQGPRKLAISRVTDALPGLSVGHEVGHLFETTLSPEELAHIQKKTLDYYGPEQLLEYHKRYEDLVDPDRDRSSDPASWDDMTGEGQRNVLSEVFAEHASAVFNAVPVGKFGINDGAKNYAREIYGVIGRGLETMGVKQPELAPEGFDPKKTLTGTGIQPSMRLSTLIENAVQAKRLDGELPKTVPSKPAPEILLPSKNASSSEPANVRPVAPKEVAPGFKKGDPIGDLKNADGVLVGDGAKIAKPNEDGTYDVEYSHPDTGERLIGTVPADWLESKTTAAPGTTPTPAPADVFPRSPVTPETPFGSAKADTLPTPKTVENTTRPEASEPAKTSAAPNVRTSAEGQSALASPADQKTVDANVAALRATNDQPRHSRSVVETDYYSAKSPISHPDQTVREQQRLAADAAEVDGQPNPLRTRYQKVFVPYKLRDNANGTKSVFGMSLDKVAQNLDLLKGWLRINPEVNFDRAYLTGPEIASDLQNFLKNQANGYAGNGQKLVRPADARDITPETAGYTPTAIDPKKAQVLNLLMGMEQPQTETPGQNFARRFAEANGIQVSEIGGVSETNSLRAALRAQGFDPRILNAVVENLRVDRMTTPVKVRSDLNFPAGDTGIQRAGFMPDVSRVVETPEFKKWFGDWRDPHALTAKAKSPVSVVVEGPPSATQKNEMARRVFGLADFEKLGPSQKKDVLAKLPNRNITERRPKVVFHGTKNDFTVFESGRPTVNNYGFFGDVETTRNGLFFSDSPEQAASYATDENGKPETGAKVLPVFLDLKSPVKLDSNTNLESLAEETGVNSRWLNNVSNTWELFDGESGKAFVEGLKKAGYDGAIFKEDAVRAGVEPGATYVVFDSAQVKSATGNKGTFDGSNPDIRFMPDTAADVTRYNEIQAEWRDLVSKGEGGSPRIMELWAENETIKNRHGGMPPIVSPRRARGNDETRDVARNYILDSRIANEPHEKYATLDEDRMKKIADWYESAKHEPESPEVQKAYQSLADETLAQYRAMEKAGIKIEPYTGKGEPYANSSEMMKDVRDNKHLWFFTTDQGFGSGEVFPGALLQKSGVTINGKELVMNDLFRAVHDYFGHTAEGYEFGPRGEYNAYLAHSRMFTDAAKPALAAETLAQNAWVNFGPHLRRQDGTLPRAGEPGFVGQKERKFADQKNTLVPAEILAEVEDSGRAAQYMPAFKLGKAEVELGDEFRPVTLGKRTVGRIETDHANGGFRALTQGREDLGSAPTEKAALKLFTEENIKARPPAKATAPSKSMSSPTGWVLPSGEYVGQNDRTGVYQNTGDWHGTHLGDNMDAYAERFGLKRGKAEDLRLAALRSGFVRMRYDGASGRMGVEANVNQFKGKTKAKVEEVLEQNLGKIDRLDVNLFDDTGKIVRQSGDAIFRMDDFLKSQAVLDILSGKSVSFMPDVPVQEARNKTQFRKSGQGLYWLDPHGNLHGLNSDHETWAANHFDADPELKSKPHAAQLLEDHWLQVKTNENTLSVVGREVSHDQQMALERIGEDFEKSVVKKNWEPAGRETELFNARFMPETGLAAVSIDVDAPSLARSKVGKRDTGVSTVTLRTGEEPLPDLGQKPRVIDVGRFLAGRARKLQRIPFDSRTEKTKKAIADTLHDEINHAESLDGSAIGWYETKISEAVDTLAELHPEIKSDPDQGSLYKALLAITSNGQAVDSNFQRAEYLYSKLKETGKIESDAPWGGARQHQINGSLETLQNLIDRHGLKDTALLLNTKFTVSELKKIAEKYGVEGSIGSGEKVDHVVYGSAIFGPKVGGGFYPNLQGDFSPVTMDLWLMRTWNRINGSYGQPDPAGAAVALSDLRAAAEKHSSSPEALEISGMSDRKIGNWAEARYTTWMRNGFKNGTPFDRPAKRYSEAKEGAQESPRNGSERAFVREVFSEVDKIRADANLEPINNADKQALLWYYEKDLYAHLGVTNKKQAPADYATAARKVVDARLEATSSSR